jgi:hypothetical protein
MNEPLGHEPRDVSVRGVLAAVGGLFVAGIFILTTAWWLFDVLMKRDMADKRSSFPLAADERGRLPREPRLEPLDRLEGKSLDARPSDSRADEQRRLESYAWVDEKAGIVRIPIERAMKLIVEKNLLPASPQRRNQK